MSGYYASSATKVAKFDSSGCDGYKQDIVRFQIVVDQIHVVVQILNGHQALSKHCLTERHMERTWLPTVKQRTEATQGKEFDDNGPTRGHAIHKSDDVRLYDS